MNPMDVKTAMAGPRRFQWQVGGWFGSVSGGSAWLIPAAIILGLNGQSRLALLPAGCCLALNALGVWLWYRRDRLLPFRALLGMLSVLAVLTPLVWFSVSLYATPESLTSLNWPQSGITGAMVASICPAIIAWFCILEYSHRDESLRVD
jgi:hypothetical protein